MKKLTVIIATIVFLNMLSVFAFAGHKTENLPKTNVETSETAAAANNAVQAAAEVVDLSSKFPGPGSQGDQGSCTAWAVGYALKSF